MQTAYLYAIIDTSKKIVTHAVILNDSSPTISKNEFYALISEASAKTYEEAVNKIKYSIETYPWYGWIKPILEI